VGEEHQEEEGGEGFLQEAEVVEDHQEEAVEVAVEEEVVVEEWGEERKLLSSLTDMLECSLLEGRKTLW